MIEPYLIDNLVRPEVCCSRCGYDLRGQSAEGLCPECGQTVAATFAFHDLQRSLRGVPLEQADPKWLTQIFEGSMLTLIAAGLVAVIALCPDSWFAWRTTPRAYMLGMACTAWVLSNYGCWKMAAREPVAGNRKRMHKGLVVRVLLLAYLIVPFWVGWSRMGPNDETLNEWVVIVMYLAAMLVPLLLVPILLLLIWSHWIRRRGYSTLAILVSILAGIAPFHLLWQIAIMESLDADASSIRFMLGLPLLLLGTPAFAREGLFEIGNGRAVWFVAPSAAILFVLLATNVMVFWLVHQSRRPRAQPSA